MKHFLLTLVFFFSVQPMFSQFDLNKCRISITEDFSPRILFFANKYFIRQAYNSNTLYIRNRDNYDDLVIFNSSALGIRSVAIDPVENIIAVSDYNKTIKIFDISKKILVEEIKMSSLAYTMKWKGEKLYCGRKDGYLQINDLNSSNKKIIKAHHNIISDLIIVNDILYTISFDGYLKIWDITNTLKLIKKIPLGKVLTKLDVSVKHCLITIGTFDGSILILKPDIFKLNTTIKPHSNIITQIKIKDNNTIVSSSFDKTIKQTKISSEKYTKLFSSKAYIINFDIEKYNIIYSTRRGHINYFNFQCKTTKQLVRDNTPFIWD